MGVTGARRHHVARHVLQLLLDFLSYKNKFLQEQHCTSILTFSDVSTTTVIVSTDRQIILSNTECDLKIFFKQEKMLKTTEMIVTDCYWT